MRAFGASKEDEHDRNPVSVRPFGLGSWINVSRIVYKPLRQHPPPERAKASQ